MKPGMPMELEVARRAFWSAACPARRRIRRAPAGASTPSPSPSMSTDDILCHEWYACIFFYQA